MKNNWRQYLDEDYEDDFIKVERIPHRPKNEKELDDKKKKKIDRSTKTDKN